MSPSAERLAVTAAVTAILVVFFVQTLYLTRVARLVPLAVVVMTLALVALELAAARVSWLRAVVRRLDSSDMYGVRAIQEKRSRLKPPPPDQNTRRARERELLPWIALLPALVYLLGLLIGLPAYLWLYLRFRGGERVSRRQPSRGGSGVSCTAPWWSCFGFACTRGSCSSGFANGPLRRDGAAQNISFTPNWSWRALVAVVVICPAPARYVPSVLKSTAALGRPRFTQLNALKASKPDLCRHAAEGDVLERP